LAFAAMALAVFGAYDSYPILIEMWLQISIVPVGTERS